MASTSGAPGRSSSATWPITTATLGSARCPARSTPGAIGPTETETPHSASASCAPDCGQPAPVRNLQPTCALSTDDDLVVSPRPARLAPASGSAYVAPPGVPR